MDRLRLALAWFMCYSFEYFYRDPQKWEAWDNKLQALKGKLKNG